MLPGELQFSQKTIKTHFFQRAVENVNYLKVMLLVKFGQIIGEIIVPFSNWKKQICFIQINIKY